MLTWKQLLVASGSVKADVAVIAGPLWSKMANPLKLNSKLQLRKPLLFQSKILCFSLFYLFSSIILALYAAISSTNCFFTSFPFHPIPYLFSYPSSYGEHKHAIPTLRSSCDSPVYFSDYKTVVKEFQRFFQNSTELGSRALTYMQGDHNLFGGNLNIQERLSFFDHSDEGTEIPCGFFKPFPIMDHDRIAMEKCDKVVVVSAIFNDHDKIRQPKGLGAKSLDSVCFFMFVDDTTLKGLIHHNLISTEESKEHKIGVWRLVKVSSEDLYENPAMNGVIPKYLAHRLFPNSKYSIWMDAKLQLVVDPLLLIHSLIIKEGVDMAISQHPLYLHTMEDAMATARWKKWWDINQLKLQMETYCENGLEPWSPNKPYPSDVPDTALILRKHTIASNLLSCLLFNELEAFNPRDQLAFAYVRDQMNPKLKLNMFDVEVFEQVAIEFRHNLKQVVGTIGTQQEGHKIKRASFDFTVNGGHSKCDKYLLSMWGESHD